MRTDGNAIRLTALFISTLHTACKGLQPCDLVIATSTVVSALQQDTELPFIQSKKLQSKEASGMPAVGSKADLAGRVPQVHLLQSSCESARCAHPAQQMLHLDQAPTKVVWEAPSALLSAQVQQSQVLKQHQRAVVWAQQCHCTQAGQQILAERS